MASSVLSSAATFSRVNRTPTQAADMVAPLTGLKSSAAFPVTRNTNSNITSLASNCGKVHCMQVHCMQHGFVYSEHNKSPGYYNGRYWTMWKLPLFGCTDTSQVLKEVEECKKEYSNAFIRIIGFDNSRQVQCISFIAYKHPH